MRSWEIRDSIVAVLIGAVVITICALLYQSCENAESKRIECIKTGHSPSECRDAFKWGQS